MDTKQVPVRLGRADHRRLSAYCERTGLKKQAVLVLALARFLSVEGSPAGAEAAGLAVKQQREVGR